MGFARRIRAHFGSFQDLVLFGRISTLTALLPVLIRILSLPRLLQLLTPAKLGEADPGNEVIGRTLRYTEYLLNRGSWTSYNNCLRRSLVLYHFLRKEGVPVQVCFGVRSAANSDSKEDLHLKGHAWLVRDGEIFLERDRRIADECAVTYRFPNDVGDAFKGLDNLSE